MKHTTGRAAAVLLGICTVAIPAASPAQTAMTGSQQGAIYRYAMEHFDAETQTLATMHNQIPAKEIVTVSTASLPSVPARRGAYRISTPQHAALEAALAKATVADVDRNNGQSPDQSSLAEYLQHLNIDPNRVVAVDVNGKMDPQNPRVTVFYRK